MWSEVSQKGVSIFPDVICVCVEYKGLQRLCGYHKEMMKTAQHMTKSEIKK